MLCLLAALGVAASQRRDRGDLRGSESELSNEVR
jgi:hypothetical protein